MIGAEEGVVGNKVSSYLLAQAKLSERPDDRVDKNKDANEQRRRQCEEGVVRE
jgi:hypothetical protein